MRVLFKLLVCLLALLCSPICPADSRGYDQAERERRQDERAMQGLEKVIEHEQNEVKTRIDREERGDLYWAGAEKIESKPTPVWHYLIFGALVTALFVLYIYWDKLNENC